MLRRGVRRFHHCQQQCRQHNTSRALELTQPPPTRPPAQVRVSDLVAAATFYAHFFLAVAGPADRLPAVPSRTRADAAGPR